MTSKLNEMLKVDLAVDPQSLASSNDTGAYHSLAGYKRALFYFNAAAIADGQTVVAQIMEAQDNIGTGAAALTGATATITSPAKLTKGLFTASTIVDTDHVVVQIFDETGTSVSSQTYTAEDTTPDATAGEFATGADDDAAMVNLAVVVNSLQGTYLQAVAGTSICTLNVREPGKYTMTLTGHTTTVVASALEAAGYVEVDAAQLSSGFSHVACKLTTDATIVVGATLLREGLTGGQAIAGQAVAGYKVL